MEAYVQSVVGVAVSVLLFLLGYRQTIGARRERARSANADIERTLLRRIVLESYTPTVEDIGRLTDGKARDYRVNVSELLSESQLLNTLFARILESDFLTAEQRKEVAGRLSSGLHEAEAPEAREGRALELVSTEKRLSATRTVVGLLATAASGVGVVVSALAAATGGTDLIWPVVAAFPASLAIIAVIIVAYRFREMQEEPSRAALLVSARDFEIEVWKAIPKVGARPAARPDDVGYDFAAQLAGKKVLIAAKAWSRRPPLQLFRIALDRLEQAAESEHAQEAILVMPYAPDVPMRYLKIPGLRVMTLDELRDYVAHPAP
jgi:hypothetical protein